MERVEALIKRLNELFETKNANEEMLLVTQMLTSELQATIQQQKIPRKISIIMPTLNTVENIPVTLPSKSEAKIILAERTPETEKIILNGNTIGNLSNEEKAIEETSKTTEDAPLTEPAAEIINPESRDLVKPEKSEAANPNLIPEKELLPFTFNLNEILSISSARKVSKSALEKNCEINEVMANKEISLNDRLKVNNTEIGTKIKDTPIKDLKKAVGLNDRFTFIQELFRGDEIMYERSIKTINSFSVLPEAEYWIQRELKVKIGWNDESETVKQFDQLVKRRFASI